ncbi:hypothetical protein BCR32DRAFT_297742 [Anaeromyces robustus]|uniref:UBA domain-containing protein n=1 Tax=Anaeromyces robustus TaxID=1754192 RepID=A0A1Y1VVR6_9FUNG|nr:hypothetical protein BCR32DRAFT_297742 [Anaeromyces robustus]|eukprot:ORX65392.1 hypothetical protein BCR32DRAFT_297742 [Anaeromyces robustus]
MDISFWVDIGKQKKYVSASINREALTDKMEFEKAVINIMENNNVPLYLKSLMEEEINNMIKIERMENTNFKEYSIDEMDNESFNTKRNMEALIETFKNNTIKYNKSSFQPVFPKAYNSLINSQISSISDMLLALERDYAKQLEKIWETKEKTETDMENSYNQQMDSRNGGKSTNYIKYHEDMELIKATFDSQIEEIKNIQKKEYHFFIENLYNKLKNRDNIESSDEIENIILSIINDLNNYISKNNTKITPVLNDLIIKIRTKLKLDSNNGNTSSQYNSNLNSPINTEFSNKDNQLKLPLKDNENKEEDVNRKEKNKGKEMESDKEENPNVKELLDMGFTNEQALAALELSKNNLEQSIFYLLEKPFVVEEHIKKTKEKANELKNLSFNSMLNLTWAEKEKLITSSATESLLPISKSLTNLNLKSTSLMGMKKLGSFFGSIKDYSTQSSVLNNEIKQSDEPENFECDSPLDTELSESFTIYHGTQVRMMYNIRVSVQNFDNIFKIPKNNEQQLAYFAQTASSLYSDNINGIIVLLTPSDWPKYAMGESANKTLINQCKRTTEFHFDDIEKQLSTIEKTLPKKDGKPILNEGDFFVTCHSNLPLIHVVFHLVVNDAHNVPNELFSRSKCINGYKNILSYAHKYDINNLTIPLLILPNDQINNMIEKSKKNKITSLKDSILNQYIEVLLKNTKVYMIESSRMIKHSLDSSGTEKNSRTLQFILPKIIDNDSFYNVVDKISKIFRTS